MQLRKDKNVVIMKADKGNAVVVLDINDYRKKIYDILDSDKFEKLDSDPTVKRELAFRTKLLSLKKEGKIDNKTYDRITPCGSRAGVLYGLPKIHKEGAPLRPIISAVQTYNYNVAKYLDEILKPALFKDDNYMLKDSFDFINKISKVKPKEGQYIVSFDVESLFTNVPTDDTIDIIIDKIFVRGVSSFHGLTEEDLRSLLETCIKRSHFQFNGAFYDQIDGVSMGSPLGPLFANVFMSHLESKIMSQLSRLGVKHWMRFVDDIFALLTSKEKADNVLDYLNKQHPNIKFTVEHEKDNSLPFLDVVIRKTAAGFETTVYRKKTYTGVHLNWTSLTSKRYKIGLIRCKLNRIWRICSSEQLRDEEITNLKEVLRKNGYPEVVITKEIEAFKKRKATRDEQPPPTNVSVEPDGIQTRRQVIAAATAAQQKALQEEAKKPVKRFIVLPYTDNRSEFFASRLKNLVENSFVNVSLNVAFTTPNEIGKLFPFKDRVQELHKRSLVVYKIRCGKCGAEYIGKTARILGYRIREHRNIASSAVHQHLNEPGNEDHWVDWDNDVTIIDGASSNRKLLAKEELHIRMLKPALNVQLMAQAKAKDRLRPKLGGPMKVSTKKTELIKSQLRKNASKYSLAG